MKMHRPTIHTNTSWQKSAQWYSNIVSDKGHYFHQHIIVPGVVRLLDIKPGQSLLDLACGQGVLARSLPSGIHYIGIDSAQALIAEAKKLNKNHDHDYIVGDVTKKLAIKDSAFDFVTIILALQNIRYPHLTIMHASQHLKIGGKMIIVLNHPCFRIPRQSSWEIDKNKKLEYRRIDSYMSEKEIPITTNPGLNNSPITWSFHYPLSSYFQWVCDAGLVVENMEEWTSNKESVGKAAKMENRSRSEFPMFLSLVCKKC